MSRTTFTWPSSRLTMSCTVRGRSRSVVAWSSVARSRTRRAHRPTRRPAFAAAASMRRLAAGETRAVMRGSLLGTGASDASANCRIWTAPARRGVPMTASSRLPTFSYARACRRRPLWPVPRRSPWWGSPSHGRPGSSSRRRIRRRSGSRGGASARLDSLPPGVRISDSSARRAGR